MKSIRFSITPEQEDIIEHEARSRGLTKSQFVKMTTFNYIAKYPSKGVFAEMHRTTAKLLNEPNVNFSEK